jgi:hypothetical protein
MKAIDHLQEALNYWVASRVQEHPDDHHRIQHHLYKALGLLKALEQTQNDHSPPSWVQGSDTSEEAASRVAKGAPTKRAQVLEYLQGRGLDGSTDYEVEQALRMPHQSASARRRELVLSGAVKDSGRRRETRGGFTATVWIVVGLEPVQSQLFNSTTR